MRPNTAPDESAQSKTLPWFRFYHETLDDPKVQRLDGATFKHWVNILCVAARHGGKLPCNADLAFALRVDEYALETLLERLLIAGLIEVRNGGVNGSHIAPHAWDKRQYKSDTSSERVKRYRKRYSNTDVTPSDTEADTETDNTPNGVLKRTRKTRCPDDFYPNPTPGSKTAQRMAEWPADYLTEQIEKFIAHHQANESRYSNWQQVWTKWALNDFDRKNANGRTTRPQVGKRNGIADALDREIGFSEPACSPERRTIGGSGADRARAIAGPSPG